MSSLGWTLVIAGLAIATVGLFFVFGPSIPWLGRLPGDIRIEGEHTRFLFPDHDLHPFERGALPRGLACAKIHALVCRPKSAVTLARGSFLVCWRTWTPRRRGVLRRLQKTIRALNEPRIRDCIGPRLRHRIGPRPVRRLAGKRKSLGRRRLSARANHSILCPTQTIGCRPISPLQHPLDWIDSAAQAVQAGLNNGSIEPTSGHEYRRRFHQLHDAARPSRTARPCASKVAGRRRNSPGPSSGSITEPNRKPTASTPSPGSETSLGSIVTAASIGLEWFFPKILETLENAPAVYDATEVWLEAGDWFVWQLVGGDASQLPRSTLPGGLQGHVAPHATVFRRPSFSAALHPKLARRRQSKNARPDARPRPVGRRTFCRHGRAVRFAGGNSRECRHDRCPRRRSRGRSRRARHAGDGDGHEQLPHAQRDGRASRPRSRRSRRRRHSARILWLRNGTSRRRRRV